MNTLGITVRFVYITCSVFIGLVRFVLWKSGVAKIQQDSK